MAVSDVRAVVGTSNRHIWVYDMRSLVEPEQRRVSSLKFQTRCVRVFPDQMGYAVGSVEGRVAVEYFDTAKVGGGDGRWYFVMRVVMLVASVMVMMMMRMMTMTEIMMAVVSCKKQSVLLYDIISV